jgi:hypothetical protein
MYESSGSIQMNKPKREKVICPTKERLSELYVDQKLSQKQIADHYHVKQNTVTGWMKRMGIQARTTLTITSPSTSASTTDPTLEGDLVLPDHLAGMNVTSKSLEKGSYQKKLLAWAAPHLFPEWINAVRRNLKLNEVQTMKLAAEVFGITKQANSGINVNVNQNNAVINEQHNTKIDGPASFEEIARILAAEEHSRRLIPAAESVQFDPTPDGPGTPDVIDVDFM